MKQNYTTEELCALVEAMDHLFDAVALIDPHAGMQLDPATCRPVRPTGPVPALDAKGRGVRRVSHSGAELLVIYQAVHLRGRPLVLALGVDMPQSLSGDQREANAWERTMSQYFEDLRHDYVTGVYNRRYLSETYMPYAAEQAAAGRPVSVVMARVNEFARLCREESSAAADNCLCSAAGILQLAVGPDHRQAVLVRLEDGLFAVVAVGRHAAELEAALWEAVNSARRSFSLSLSRRGEFTVSMAGADWGETGSWEMLLSLAQQRLGGV